MNRTPTFLGTRVGDYRLEAFLGAGGMGEVYRGVHGRIDRVVAVKVLRRDAASTEFTRRFLNEARIHARLRHPNIAALYDLVETSGRPCIIMEYVDGQTLEERIRATGGLPVRDALEILRCVAAALAYVHRQGVVHRDVKPHNIKVASGGDVKLLDFGIAKTDAVPGLTATGMVVGTPEYLAPEQVRGRPVDARTDVWALGLLLYEMLTGRLPFEASSLIELYEQIDRGTYVPPSALAPDVPPEVEALIRRCLSRHPRDRYASAAPLLDEVERLLSGDGGSSARRRSTMRWSSIRWDRLLRLPRRAVTPARLGSTMFWAAAGAGIVLALMLLVMPGPRSTPRDGPDSEERTVPRGPDVLPPDTSLFTTTVDVIGPPAQVFRDGELLGTTPLPIEAPLGSHVQLTLRRDGREHVMGFQVSVQKKIYTEPF